MNMKYKKKKPPFFKQNNDEVVDDQNIREVAEVPQSLFKDHKDEELLNEF